MGDKKANFNGLVLVDKPLHLTSHDVAHRLRRFCQQKSVGHTGTLDPLASGLMVLCLGGATKLARFLDLDQKVYHATIRLGKRSTTLDAEGVFDSPDDTDQPDVDLPHIKSVLARFVGHIEQRVPMYSAVKVDGKRLYKSARSGEEVERPVRTVRIDEIEMIDYIAPEIRVAVRCGGGTYIRSLAADIGESLGCGAYLSKLRRTAVGGFNVTDAHTLERLDEFSSQGSLGEVVLSAEGALTLPTLTVAPEFEPRVRHGVRPQLADIKGIGSAFDAGAEVSLINDRGQMLAVGVAEIASTGLLGNQEQEKVDFYRYLRVL